MGIISPVGSTLEGAWNNVVQGVSGIAPITRVDVTEFPCKFGGAVKDFQLDKYLTPKEARRMDEFMHYGIAAGVDRPWPTAGLDLAKIDLERCGVITGSGIGGLQTIEDEHNAYPVGDEPAQDLAVLRARPRSST
jgi:3-oxoacyl-[acyl-carrier-protein] synthase II